MNSVQQLLDRTRKCDSLVEAFLHYKLTLDGQLKPDYSLDELENYFYNCYNRPSFRDKDIVAIWNFPEVLKQIQEET